jgi:hypothetical protein
MRPGTRPVQLRADEAIIGTTTTADTHAAVLLGLNWSRRRGTIRVVSRGHGLR